MDDVNELLPVPEAAKRAGVARSTMFLAARSGKIKSVKLGRSRFVYASDIERWKREDYRPDMAIRYPAKPEGEEGGG
jgi:excisionase family DNA binding protein